MQDLKDERFETIIPKLLELFSKDDIISIQSNNTDIKAWVDLAQILFCKIIDISSLDNKLTLTLKKIDISNSFHTIKDIEEKYGQDSKFAHIDKMNQPAFLHYYLQALHNVKIDSRKRVLNLGVNSGEEFEIIQNQFDFFNDSEFIGIDYCDSAITKAKEKFSSSTNVSFYRADINNLENLDLGKFDCIITIGTLQSASLNFKTTFMDIIQNYLEKDGSLIMGFPNCRWYDENMIYGAKAPNYNFSEMSILYNDVIFCKKYLQQKKFRVTITGKEYIFLTATSIRK